VLRRRLESWRGHSAGVFGMNGASICGQGVAQQLAQTRPGARGVLPDLEAAQALVDSDRPSRALPLSREEHVFADSSLPAYDAASAALPTERVLAFLNAIEVNNMPMKH
jgi:hypothetical protein